MIKILTSSLISFFLFFTSVLAEVINKIEVKNNNRISKQTIITYQSERRSVVQNNSTMVQHNGSTH